MVPVPGSGPRLSGCRGPAAPSCSLQMQTQSPFLEGKNDTTKGKITLRVLNQIWNQRLQNNINSSFARKNASEMVFQKVVGRMAQSKTTSQQKRPTHGSGLHPLVASPA